MLNNISNGTIECISDSKDESTPETTDNIIVKKEKVICNFRANDIKNNGEGAPLSPIYHKLLINKFTRIQYS